MTSSTRSKKVVKQEEEEQPQEDQNSVVPAQEALSPRPQTSLLSLPDDLLMQIYEELYEDQYGAKTISPPVSEILINKRIFNLARPIWFSRLSISKDQNDLRLSSLMLDVTRRKDLRKLELVFLATFTHLTRIVLSQLQSLTKVQISFHEDLPPQSRKLLLEAMSENETLKHFTLRFLVSPHGWLPRTLELAQLRSKSVEGRGERWKIFGLTFSSGLVSFQMGQDFGGFCEVLKWESVVSFSMENPGDTLPQAENLLHSLQQALSRVDDGQLLPLEHLSLSLYFDRRAGHHRGECFGSDNLTKLFRLLCRTRFERIELTGVNWIPRISAQLSLMSVKLLRIDGACSFAKDDNFEKLFLILRTFPSLIQLHLSGQHFFRENVSADDIAKLETFEMLFRFPLLGTLLAYLRSTKVKIFTYRGRNEEREIRWTRVSTEEDFDRDCWTL